MFNALVVQQADASHLPLGDGMFSSISKTDIRKLRFSGAAAANQGFHGNFVECVFNDFHASAVNFSRCDWKDCRLRNCTFVDCDLGGAAIITNWFENCRFVRCRFPDTGVSDCEFAHCTFTSCDLTHIIVKSSWLENVFFEQCETSNRVIESSVLLDCQFINTDVEVRLVTGNFGPLKGQFDSCRLFIRRSEEKEYVDWNVFANDNTGSDASVIERFRISTFLTGSVDGDSTVLEATLNPENWTGGAPVPASFGATLSHFTRYMLTLYRKGEIPAYIPLKFHTSNFFFLEKLNARPDLASLYQAAAGAHLTLTREVDAFACVLQEVVDAVKDSNIIHVGANGPLDVEYFQNELLQIGVPDAKVVSVKPRNSPVDLALFFSDINSVVGFAALFLACRTKIELARISDELQNKGRNKAQQRVSTNSLIMFKSGFSVAHPSEYEINLRTVLPRSLLLDLRISIGTAAFKRAKFLLTELLGGASEGKKTEAPDKDQSDTEPTL